MLLAFVACDEPTTPDDDGTTDTDTDTPPSDTDSDVDTDTDAPPTDTDDCDGALGVAIGDAAGGIYLEADAAPFADRPSRSRTITVPSAGTLTVDGPGEVLQLDGTIVPNGGAVGAGSLLVRATAAGEGSLTLTYGVCTAALSFRAGPAGPMSARPLDLFPWAEHVDLFTADDEIHLAIDPVRYSDRVGVPFDAWVVPHRSAAEWAADPVIDTAAAIAGPVAAVVPSTTSPILLVADPIGGSGIAEPYTVVLDFDGDGEVGPDDLVDDLDRPGLSILTDLTAPGPYTPVSDEVSFDVWHTFLAYWPEEIDTLDPIPLVVISHGNGHDYTWYDYLGFHLSSWGYAVVVHTNDTGDPSIDPAATTTWTNTEAFLGNLGTILGGQLDGEIDADRIAWIGHSRGGEGVVIAYAWLADGEIAPASYSVDDILLVSSIAPTVFNTPNTVDPHGVVYHQIDGSADGDVTGSPSSGITQYFRIFLRATGTKLVTYVHGASHNDFNCCGFMDGTGPGLIGRDAAQRIAKSYYLALTTAVFEDRPELYELFSRNPAVFRPESVTGAIVSQAKRADGDRVFVIDDFQANPDFALSSSGTTVAYDVSNFGEGPLDDADGQLAATIADPMNGMTWSDGDANPDRGAIFDWEVGDDVSFEVEIATTEADWTDNSFVSFRACQGTRHPYTEALDTAMSFHVEIEDATGATSAVDIAAYGGIASPYNRGGEGAGTGWSNEFQTVRIPVSAFTADGRPIDLSSITTLRFLFGSAWGSDQGRMGLDDIALLQEATP
jgi:hypothetical protein